ncbi:MAG TPA: hypothetical protein VJ723_03830, partial [Candidatus Angelobacter sp.]|nr:hypothetical protein [Candidatus Angelobacter sp.]
MKQFSLSTAMAVFFCLGVPAGSVLFPDLNVQQPASSPSKPVLKANTRLVVVDVVATDRQGQPISGLQTQDFTVFEDGRQQKISDFSYQQPGTRVTQVTLHLPPNVVSNVPLQKSSVLNVVLLDTL